MNIPFLDETVYEDPTFEKNRRLRLVLNFFADKIFYGPSAKLASWFNSQFGTDYEDM